MRYTLKSRVGLSDEQIDEAIRLAGAQTALTTTVRFFPLLWFIWESRAPNRRPRPLRQTTLGQYYRLYGELVLCVEWLMSRYTYSR